MTKKISLISFDEELENKELHVKYLNWLNDREIIKSIAAPSLLKKKELDFIYSSFKRFTSKNSIGFFIKYNDNQEYIGTCKLDQIDYNSGVAWDGIMIGEKRYHGKGLSIEVYKSLLDFAFNKLNLNIIYGGCSSYNLPMIKTFEKIGYSYFKRNIKTDFIDGKYYDHVFYQINKNYFNDLHDH
ncbi:GNAT family protein [Aliarcobacter skirrowii]|uniref:GNAT family N-acetyltransferase n=1 Tax=Aliarcobacter skirrowii TaxID=28200 RepID=UPI0029BC9B3A|nr:GNAT family protein [Aliarcobacter skirrowii]MDX4059294.1 GNAT family protein [Aliarcobacter skirrowii]